MKKKTTTIAISALLVTAMGMVLANNKAKINKAAHPVKENMIIPVRTYTVSEVDFNSGFTVNGTTIPAKEVKLASEVQGKLIGLYIDNGDEVRAGQTIATLDASVYNAQLRSIEASIAKATLDLQRYTHLITLGGATPMQAEGVQLQLNSLAAEKQSVKEQIEHMQVRSPFSGKIENVAVERGSFVSYGTVLSQLIDNSTLKIDVYLSEQQAFKTKRGQQVSVRSVVFGQPRSGTVTMISDKADASGKFLAEISFPNTGKDQLKAGMLADVDFATESKEKGLAIPVSALTGGAQQPKVYIVKGDRVELKTIRTGAVISDKVQVTEGLQAGEQVVTSGQLNLEDGTVVTINK